MKRTGVAVVLALAALALLSALVMRSRAIPVEAHLAHHAALSDLGRVADDFDALTTTLASAFQNLQAPGEGVRVVLDRLAASPDRIGAQLPLTNQGTSQQLRLQHSYDHFTTSIHDAAGLAAALLEQQQAYAEHVAYLRESGPQLVQQMRDIRLDRVAAEAFQLIAGTLEFARPANTSPDSELQRLFVALGRDQRIDANMPGDVTRLRAAISGILTEKSVIRSELEQLASAPVPASIDSLRAAADDLYRATLIAVEQARVMLAIYAMLLLAAAGFVAYRLHDSYRQLNAANTELGALNQSLEHRVRERTAELENTLHDLRESQVQLVQAEKMSSLGQLVAGISHEINTPLLYLANNAILIRERLDGTRQFVRQVDEAFSVKPEDGQTRTDHQARFVDRLKQLKLSLRDQDIAEGLDEACDLVRDSIEGLDELTTMAQSLKDFSRLDRAPTARFDVNSGLEKTLTIAKNIIKHKAEVRKFFGEVPEITCSPSQINQVFLNIITNAAQAIETQGEIVITTKLEDDQHVAIRIADNGCGIPEQNLTKIRDPFFTTKDVGTGTGLGLSIVDEIIRSHHGELRIESEVGKGSIFTIVLPIAQPNTAGLPRSDAEQESDAGRVIDGPFLAEAG
jgi:signal transduction histidine kinase